MAFKGNKRVEISGHLQDGKFGLIYLDPKTLNTIRLDELIRRNLIFGEETQTVDEKTGEVTYGVSETDYSPGNIYKVTVEKVK